MDEFFEIPEINAEPERESDMARPPWVEPPHDVIAGLVPDRRTLAKTAQLTILLTHIDAFPTGASLRLRIVARWLPTMSEDDWREQWDTVFDHRPGGGRPTAVSADFLRIGVQFADGRRATNLIPEWERPWNRDGRTPPEPSLTEHGRGGSSGDRYLTQGRSLWLWPLPPPEPFDLVIEWPAFKIPVTRTSIDGAAIVAAAQGTEPAWLKPQA